MSRAFSVLSLLSACLLLTSCEAQELDQRPTFVHHFIATDLPGNTVSGYGAPTLADFDADGDLDFALNVPGDSLYWFEFQGFETWIRRGAGVLPHNMLAAVSLDVDGDGNVDILTGEVWFRNPGDPRRAPFERYHYDTSIDTEIHDIAIADINSDGVSDIVALGDKEGCFWYEIPSDPLTGVEWERTAITLDVLDSEGDIHGGLAPSGVGDLDGDGDPDVVLAGQWMENTGDGAEWAVHRLPYGAIGPWGHSFRSWIEDVDGDGDNDIIVTDCDQAGSRALWLENDGDTSPEFTVNLLPNEPGGGTGSFHSLSVADFDGDGDQDIFSVEQEDDKILPPFSPPRWFLWERLNTPSEVSFEQHIIFDGRLGGHDAIAGDVDGDGDLDICSKIWRVWIENANGGREHADCLENMTIHQ
jgi:hypothetical protein